MLQQLTNRIYYMAGDAETDRPYLYYVYGDKYSLAVDAGSSKAHVEAFYKAIEEKGLPKPHYTVLTHWHWDHTFGLHAVEGQTIASAKTNQKLREVKTWKWTVEAMKARERTGEDIPFCNACIQKVYKDLGEIKVITANIEVEGTMTIDLGGVTCQIEHQDSTHSRDALFIYFPEERALAIGDADSEDHYENGGKYDKTRLLGIIAYIKQFAFDHYLLGHDKPDTKEGALSYLTAELEKLK
nr:MBL fold metallo-hydrolase [uncultured Cellulosilyticum sp.]